MNKREELARWYFKKLADEFYWNDIDEPTKEKFRTIADEILAIMREPSAEMLQAVAKHNPFIGIPKTAKSSVERHQQNVLVRFTVNWRAAIDAAGENDNEQA